MPDNPDPLAALADIELPAPPDWGPVLLAAAALLALLVLVLGALLVFRLQRRRRVPAAGDANAEALARLERLQRQWRARELDGREASYRLAALLRIGLGCGQLRAATPPVEADPEEWRAALRLLQSLRYQPAAAIDLTVDVFERARGWLAAHAAAGANRV